MPLLLRFAATVLLAQAAASQETTKVTTGPSGEVIQDDTNPYVEQGDSTEECFSWAADGQCIQNPGFMLSSCKYSCWEWYTFRRQKYPDAPIDKHFSCNSWASQGECSKNKVFMKEGCSETCKDKWESESSEPKTVQKKKKKSKKKKASAKE